jgi:hypothetical protein
MASWYAVWHGRVPVGQDPNDPTFEPIYDNWRTTFSMTGGVPSAKFKKCASKQLARDWLKDQGPRPLPHKDRTPSSSSAPQSSSSSSSSSMPKPPPPLRVLVNEKTKDMPGILRVLPAVIMAARAPDRVTIGNNRREEKKTKKMVVAVDVKWFEKPAVDEETRLMREMTRGGGPCHRDVFIAVLALRTEPTAKQQQQHACSLYFEAKDSWNTSYLVPDEYNSSPESSRLHALLTVLKHQSSRSDTSDPLNVWICDRHLVDACNGKYAEWEMMQQQPLEYGSDDIDDFMDLISDDPHQSSYIERHRKILKQINAEGQKSLTLIRYSEDVMAAELFLQRESPALLATLDA